MQRLANLTNPSFIQNITQKTYQCLNSSYSGFVYILHVVLTFLELVCFFILTVDKEAIF